jgi:hypothetical protein
MLFPGHLFQGTLYPVTPASNVGFKQMSFKQKAEPEVAVLDLFLFLPMAALKCPSEIAAVLSSSATHHEQ